MDELDLVIRKRFDEGIGDYLEKIKSDRKLTDEDIEALTGVKVSDARNVTLDRLSGLEVMRIIELCSDEKPTLELIEAYRNNAEHDRLGRKLDMMLDLFGVSDEATLDKLLDKAIEVRTAIGQVMDDCVKQKEEDKGCAQKQCTCESGDNVCKGRHSRCTANRKHRDKPKENGPHGSESGYASYTHYDSRTMDKPETKTWKWSDGETETVIKEIESEMSDLVGPMKDLFGIKLKPTLS